MKAACPLCRRRQAKRACPAKGEAICSACCGQKRRVEIDCPDDCLYLTGSHASGWSGRETEQHRDVRRMAPGLSALEGAQQLHFAMAIVGIALVRRDTRGFDDALLLEALSAARKTAETRQRGILYEHAPEDRRAQGLLPGLRELIEIGAGPERPVELSEPDERTVLVALERCVRQAIHEREGPTLFLDTAERMARRMKRDPRPAPAIVAL